MRTIGQARQRVVPRHVRNLRLGATVLRNVPVRGDPAAIGHRSMIDLEDLAAHQLDDGIRRLVGHRDAVSPGVVLIPRHQGTAAGLEPEVDDFAQCRAGSHAIGIKSVHLGVAPVADDQALHAVEEAQALRHVVERRIELQGAKAEFLLLQLDQHMLFLDLRVQPLPIGNVIVRSNAAAVRHGTNRVGNDAPVGKFLDRVGRLHVAGRTPAHIVRRIVWNLQAELEPPLDQLTGRCSGCDLLGGQAVDLAISLVANDNLSVLVENDEALR